MIYLVVWSGGYEPPSYAAFGTKQEAIDKANEWWGEMDIRVDTIDVIAIAKTGDTYGCSRLIVSPTNRRTV